MSNLRIVLILAVSLLTIGCQEDFVLDVNLPESPAEIVVSGIFHPDSTFTVFVNSSVHSVGPDKAKAITNARVEILESGQVIDVLPFKHIVNNDGFSIFYDGGAGPINESERSTAIYKSNSAFPEVGKVYGIRVSADGYDEVTGSGQVPMQVPISDAIYVHNTRIDDTGFPRGEIKIILDDPPGEQNFYNLRHHYRSLVKETNFRISYTDGFELVTRLQDDFFGADPEDLVGDNETFRATSDGISFSDVLFDGAQKEIVIDVAADICGLNDPNADTECQHVIELSSISEDLYNYHRTVQLQNAAKQNPFAEPVRIISNMSNDLGVFSGMNRSVWLLIP